MRIDNTSNREKKKKKKESQRKSDFEGIIFEIMRKSLKSAIDVALDDIFKEWK